MWHCVDKANQFCIIIVIYIFFFIPFSESFEKNLEQIDSKLIHFV